MVGAGAGGNVGGTAEYFLGSWVEDNHQVALVVDALNGCCSFALVKIAHEVDVMVIALQLLDELDNIGDKVSQPSRCLHRTSDFYTTHPAPSPNSTG